MKKKTNIRYLVGCLLGGSILLLLTRCLIEVPTLTTLPVDEIMQESAKSGGHITDDGGAKIEIRGIVWHLVPLADVEIHSGMTSDGAGVGAFTSELTDLYPGLTYYVRAYATNSEGTAYGNELTFTTLLPLFLPEVTTSSISFITQTTATGGGYVSYDGNAAISARGIVWATSENPTTESNQGMTSEGTGLGSFTSDLTDLEPGTTYYVRAYATNSEGTAYGYQVDFDTEEIDLCEPFLQVCEGQGMADAAAYPGNNNIHSIVICGWDLNIDDQWKPASVQETELVACFNVRQSAIQVCNYTNGGKHTRYQMVCKISLRAALTGVLIASTTFYGGQPPPCPQTITGMSSWGYGSSVSDEKIINWLKYYVAEEK